MNIAISGATGKMGQEILKLISAEKELSFAGGTASKTQKDKNIFSSYSDLGNNFDVIIDFSLPEVFSEALAWAVKAKKPFLSGTTGLSDKQKKQLAEAGKKIPVLWSPNTSPGIHIVKNILQGLNIPAAFDVQLTEYHHKFKKDKPSGTGILLQDELKKKKKNIPEPISIRGGGIFGIHRIELMSAGETITIEHEALGRHLFAQGAIDAALWLVKQNPGSYSMDDFLKNYK